MLKLRRKRMLELLVIKKMSQTDLAKAIGTTQSQISYAINGSRKLTQKQSKRLIELFGAELVSRVIDWDAMGLCDPFGDMR